MIIDLSQGEHSAVVDIFSDKMSLAHLAYGYACGSINNPKVGTGMVALFTGYQVSQAQTNEPWERTGGEFIELAIGILLAQIG